MNMIRSTLLVFLVALCIPCPASAQTGHGTEGLTQVTDWEKLANGVFSTVIGNHEGEQRYSDLAAAPPKLEALNGLADVPLTKALTNVRFRITEDHKIVVQIPTEEGEQIYGFGLQFDTTKQTKRIVELKVDHFAKGGGATHAPVPFYISSKGYGVFFNTAKFIKIYSQNSWGQSQVPESK